MIGNCLSRQAIAALVAFAPSAGLAADGPARQPVESVTVTGERPAVLNLLDRKVYDLSADLQSSAGSASDVLQNIPSVEVDVSGDVTLRGDPNVEILIDGRQSTLMNPSNRGAALQQMDADSIERIEVITTPSAQFGSEGSAGVINIITKKDRAEGLSESAQASFGSEGRYNLGVNLTYKDGPLALRNKLTARQDVRKRVIGDERTDQSASTDTPQSSLQQLVTDTVRVSVVDTASVDYDLDKSRTLSASVTYNDRAGRPISSEADRSFAGNSLNSAYRRSSGGAERQINTSGTIKFSQAFEGDGHRLDLDWHRDESSEEQYYLFSDIYDFPNQPPSADDQLILADEVLNQFNAKYDRGRSSIGDIVLGGTIETETDDYINFGNFIAGPALIPNPLLTSHFRYAHQIFSAFATDDLEIGAWSFQFGLRLEQAFIDTNQVTTAQQDHTRYLKLHPSLNAEYVLNDSESLKFGYSHRLVRPRHEDLDPYPFYQDAFTVKAGNPHLKPEETHSVEAGYTARDGADSFQATAYFREKSNVLTQISEIIAGNILLTTKENLGQSTTGGLEAIIRRSLAKWLLINASANVYYIDIDASNLGISTKRSTVTASGKLGADLQLAKDTVMQISTNYSGERLLPQGYRRPIFGANLGFRTKLDKSLTATVTISDLFNSQYETTVISTPTLHDRYSRRQLGQVAYFGLSWTPGRSKQKSERGDSFDYGEPQ